MSLAKQETEKTLDTVETNGELLATRKAHFLPTAAHYYQEPLHLVRAKGSFVYDEQGREFLDVIGGIVCISAGHNHPRIQQRMIEMITNDEIQHTTTLYLNRYATRLADKLTGEAPKSMDPKTAKVAFTNSGSEANELALLAARQATGETMVISLQHGYHGGTSGTLAHCGHHSWRFRAQPVSNAVAAIAPNCYRCPFKRDPGTCHLECAKHVEETIQTTTHGRIAAFLAEPVLGVGGFITPPEEYFHRVAEIIHRYGGKYISDEVQTGAGRCGQTFLATPSLGIDADIITMAKGFGNGAAIGATLMRADIAESMTGKMHFNTFAGDPFQAMQALTTMDIIEEEKLIENARVMGQALKDGLLELQKRHPLIGDVRGRGLLLGIELVKDRETKEYASAETAQLMELMKERGVLIGKGGLFGNVVRLAPALSINRDQAEQLLKALDESLSVLEKG
ncbi:MAG TPA: aspartate aminotransferase family protein [Coleofasciculaceae cyanobacterium]|jgi:4-aminobutyrate aminotransferase-like enzyme